MAIRSKIWMAAEVVLILAAAAEAAGADSTVRFRVQDGSRITVPVLVNGRGPYSFLLDTGSSISVVDHRIARKLGLRVITCTRLDTFTGASSLPLASVESLTLGTGSVRITQVIIGDLRQLFSLGYGFQGVLGQDSLSQWNYLSCFRNKTIRFERDGDLKSSLQGERLASERRQSMFYVSSGRSAREGKRGRFLLDSGSLEPLVFSVASEMPALDIVYMEEERVAAWTATGRRNIRSCRIGVFRIGDVVLKNIRFLVADLFPGEERHEDGLLPLKLFDAVYFNNEESYVMLNPTLPD